MQKGHRLQLACESCEAPLTFSILEKEDFKGIGCKCGRKYVFDEIILRQLSQFEALCRQIHASEEILGKASIAVDVASHQVKIPFNLLLTRLSSLIELQMNGKKLSINFRIEPLEDLN